MAEIVGCAVASESVSRIFSILPGHQREEDKAERLEFAVLKIHSVVAVSEDWQILHQPLLNWKARLKRVAEEGDGILRAHERRSTEGRRNEGADARLQATFSARKRIARAARRFVPFGRGAGRGDDDDADTITDETVRRFERLAGVADEFFRYVRFGGRPRSLTAYSFRVPTEPLLAGKTLEFSLGNGSKEALLLLHPRDSADGVARKEILLFLSYDDTTTWEKNLKLSMVFQLFDNTDILDIIMSSLELLPPQFGAACVTTREFARELLAQETSYSIDPSSMSMWSIYASTRCNRNSTEQGSAATSGRPRIPSPISRVDAIYITPPPNNSSDAPVGDDDLPLRLTCHVAPHLVPARYSKHYSQIELETLQELLPKAEDEGALERKGNWWCPRSSTFLLVEPEFMVPPPTLQQFYLMENPETST